LHPKNETISNVEFDPEMIMLIRYLAGCRLVFKAHPKPYTHRTLVYIMDAPKQSKIFVTLCCCTVVCVTFLILTVPAFAERASLVIDADSGVVLHAKNARLQSFPASLTKLMTVYLIFEAMASKQLALAVQLPVSAAAAGMPAVRLRLKQGQTITVQEILLGMMLRSANDAAVVAAERMAGSESAFADLMNAKAKTLGMSDTVFYNASGLPHPGQITSARDMAILARALIEDFPQYYPLFSIQAFQYRGKTYNARQNISDHAAGIRELKTGFTCHAGYNLVVSAEIKGRSLIGVVLGERNPRQRSFRMSEILKQVVTSKNMESKALTIHDLAVESGQGKKPAPNNKAIADVCVVGPKSNSFARASGWGVMVGVKNIQKEALALARQTKRRYRQTLKKGRPLAIPFLVGVRRHRACITDLKQQSASATCQQMRGSDQYCLVLSPKVVRMYVEKGHEALKRKLVSKVSIQN
jgi:D-alanyl-D-alanine carboxypeptidase